MIITIIRTIILYFFIVFAVRVMGKRQISEMQASELVITLVIAEIASIPMESTSIPLTSGIVPTLILVGCEILASIGMLKWSKFRRVMCGNPVMVIKDGEILQDKMRSLRLTTEDLCVQLRQQGVFSINDVQYCIAETNGKISVLQKPDKRQPSAEDMNIYIEDTGIEVVIINDGKILSNSVKLCETNENVIMDIIDKNKLTLKDIFIMTMDRMGNYNIIRNN